MRGRELFRFLGGDATLTEATSRCLKDPHRAHIYINGAPVDRTVPFGGYQQPGMAESTACSVSSNVSRSKPYSVIKSPERDFHKHLLVISVKHLLGGMPAAVLAARRVGLA
jgi:hypothetical protein